MKDRTLNVILTHQTPEEIFILLKWWDKVAPLEDILIVHGGKRENFEAVSHPQKIFLTDEAIRTVDHQREKQSYTPIFKAVAAYIDQLEYTHIYFCEYDHIPLVKDLNQKQLERLQSENADVLGHKLTRIDKTASAHYLYHLSDPKFMELWRSVGIRPDPTVVLWMLGTGSFWKRDAFTAVARISTQCSIYLELYLPTLAHHLGYRLRTWGDQDRFIYAQPLPELTMENARGFGSWTIHPIKDIKLLINDLQRPEAPL